MMKSHVYSEFIAGGVFGIALVASGVYAPSVIVAQMQAKSFQMLEVMLGASACSAVIFSIAQWTYYAPKKLRSAASLGLFSYDGNLIGGIIQGAGMALAGACPGSVLVQNALGVPNSVTVALGGLLGAFGYLTVQPFLRKPVEGCGQSSSTEKESPETISSVLGMSEFATLVIWEALCVAGLVVLSISKHSTSEASLVEPLAGGLLVGAAQAVSVFLVRHPIGVSKAYEDLALWMQDLVSTREDGPEKHASHLGSLLTPSITFTAGIFTSSLLLARSGLLASMMSSNELPPSSVSPERALLGGAMLLFGSRIAGGCTSGHGLSGLATFSISSLISTGAMFAAGLATGAMMT